MPAPPSRHQADELVSGISNDFPSLYRPEPAPSFDEFEANRGAGDTPLWLTVGPCRATASSRRSLADPWNRSTLCGVIAYAPRRRVHPSQDDAHFLFVTFCSSEAGCQAKHTTRSRTSALV